MVEMISPGVYLDEIDASQIVVGASSSTGVFAGNFKKGPVGTYVQIGNVQNLIDYYGKPDAENYNEWYQAYNFLQYGRNLLVSRAANMNGSKTVIPTARVVNSNVTVVTTEGKEPTHAFNEFCIAASGGVSGNTIQLNIVSGEQKIIHQGRRASNKYGVVKREGVVGNDYTITITGSSNDWHVAISTSSSEVWSTDLSQDTTSEELLENPFVDFLGDVSVSEETLPFSGGEDGVYQKAYNVQTYAGGILRETQTQKQTTDDLINNVWVKFIPGKDLRPGAFVLSGGLAGVDEVSGVDFRHVIVESVADLRVNDIVSFGEYTDRYIIKAIDVDKNELTLDHELPDLDAPRPTSGDDTFTVDITFGGSNEAVSVAETTEQTVSVNGENVSVQVPQPAADKYDLFDTNPMIRNFAEWDAKMPSIRFSNPKSKLKFVARNPGTWSSKLKICIAKPESFESNSTNPKFVNKYAFPGLSVDDLYEYAPRDTQVGVIIYDDEKDEVIETYNVDMVRGSRDDAGNSTFIENVINTNSSVVYVKVNDACEDEVADYTYVYDDIEEKYVGTSLRLINSHDSGIQADDLLDAYEVFSNKEELDVDIIIANELDGGASAKALTDTRKDCICFIGANYGDVVNKKALEATQNLVKWRKFNINWNSMFVCVTGNYKYMYDRYNDMYRWVNIAGDIAGLRAQTSSGKASWWASAGLERGQLLNVTKIAFNPTIEQRDQLYKNGINPVVSFPGQGVVMWGQKTLLDKASSFDRVNTRSLFNYLERSLSKMAKYQVMEFNDAYTRNRIVSMIKPFLTQVQAGRGIQDFKVVCDETNNTPQVIANNELVVDVMVQPTYVAEKILLRFTNAGTNSFSSITTA